MNIRNNKTSFDFYSLSIRENEWRMNRILGFVSLLCVALMGVCYGLTAAGIFTVSVDKMLFLTLIMLPFALYSFLITVVFKVQKPWVKYSLLIILWLFIMLVFASLSMHTVLLFCLPVLLSLLYNDRTCSLITAIIGVFAMFGGHCFSVTYSVVNDPLINTTYRALIFGFLPRFLQYALICIVAFFISRNTSVMMNKGYYYVKCTADLMAKQATTHYEIIKNLATITENKSMETGEHISRVFDYMMIFTRHLGLSEETAYNISLAAMLHDVGKLRIDEAILNKPGKLDTQEFDQIKLHAKYGKSLLTHTGNDVLELASIIAEQHHERWDGKGYHGLKEDEIDKYSQLMSVIDVFDALTSVRCYKPAWTLQDAYDEILRGRGTQFSPLAVDIFKDCIDDVIAVYERENPAAKDHPADLKK